MPTPPPASSLEANVSAISNQSQQLMGQLQAQYTQQVTAFENQSKETRDQVRALNARVSNMETQLSQLVQMLTRHAQQSSMGAPPSEAAPSPGPVVRIAYNVQAIIPGRAWLKSDSGETLTVAEGDVIKGIGRVTKIDPYDGIVEINTGTRSVSLSYGNGG
jgi:intracellular multiplication protein IcmG